MREGEGVAPEEPLEGDQTGRGDRQPDEGQGRLASRKTRVEETGGWSEEDFEIKPWQRYHTQHRES